MNHANIHPTARKKQKYQQKQEVFCSILRVFDDRMILTENFSRRKLLKCSKTEILETDEAV